MMKRSACLILGFAILGAPAANAKALTTAGTGVAIALPLIAGGISVYKDDWIGVGQLALDTVATVGTVYALKNIVRERRPDGSDYQSFPSDTTALAASGSSYLFARYGWQYGLPAIAATSFVSYTRVDARKHHWYDTLASSAIAFGYSQIFTTRFRKRYNVYTDLEASPDGAMVRFAYDF